MNLIILIQIFSLICGQEQQRQMLSLVHYAIPTHHTQITLLQNYKFQSYSVYAEIYLENNISKRILLDSKIRNVGCHKKLCTDGSCQDGNCICKGICVYGCSFGCSGKGVCVDNQCKCNKGYTHMDCSQTFQYYYDRNCPGLDLGNICNGITCDSDGTCTGQYRIGDTCPNNCSGEEHGVCNNFHRCSCLGNWSGDDCSRQRISDPLDECPGNCHGRGNCVNHTQCQCDPGWTGLDCNSTYYGYSFFYCYICQSDCYPICSNILPQVINCHYGKLQDSKCVCEKGYKGMNCDQRCTNDCSGNGICDASNKCICNPAFAGPKCDQTVEKYEQFYRQQCVKMTPGYCCEGINCIYGACQNHYCVCNQFYSGGKCEIGCQNNCSGNGVCTESNLCICEPAFTGPVCNQSAVQYDYSDLQKCKALVPGYCCQDVNCMNGQCSNGYCSCDVGSYGDQCQHGCKHNCSGNGQCVSAVCECFEGWQGVDCSIRYIPNSSCQPHNCINGKCQENICVCKIGWHGVSCNNKDLQNTQTDLCYQGKWLETQCICDPGYYGIYCDQLCSDCMSNNCPTICVNDNLSIVGLIAQISVACIACLIILLGCFFYIRKNRQKKAFDAIPNRGLQTELVPVPQVQINQNITIGNYGLPEGDLQNIQNNLARQEETKCCSICLDEINARPNQMVGCPYQHAFHIACISQWLRRHNTCPDCRVVIDF